MKIGFNKVNVDPVKPTHKFAPLGEGILTDQVKDELAVKITVLESSDAFYVHLSCPYGEFPRTMYETAAETLNRKMAKKVYLTTAVTHTHYAPKLTQEKEYAAYAVTKIIDGILHTKTMDYGQLSYCYQREYFDQVGQLRISGETTRNLFLETFSLYSGEKRLAVYVIYNSHPTTLNFNEPYFSGAGPAVLMKAYEEKHPGEFCSYMIGAAGDISTRFSRRGQTYEDVLMLTEVVANQLEKQLQQEKDLPKYPVDTISWNEIPFHVHRQPRDMSEVITDVELTPREKETLEIAKKKNETRDISAQPDTLYLQRVQLGGHIFIYTPFELFSSYLNCIDLDHSTLVNLGNGDGGYLSGPGKQKLSFEVLSETIGKPDKQRLETLLHQLSNLQWKQEA